MFNNLNTFLNNKRYGNTLSETLIAIMITGIVFTLGFGVMIADHNRNQTVIRLKKMYSTLSQALTSAKVIEGEPYTWNIGNNLSEQNSVDFFNTYLKPYLQLSKICDNPADKSCIYDFKELNGTPKELNSTWTRFFLNDGAFVALQTYGNKNYKVVYFYVDTNGKKRLNVVARDIFLFEYWIQNDTNPHLVGQLRMYGEGNSRDNLISADIENACNGKVSGNYCGALIKYDSWQIKEGYPWAHARYVVK